MSAKSERIAQDVLDCSPAAARWPRSPGRIQDLMYVQLHVGGNDLMLQRQHGTTASTRAGSAEQMPGQRTWSSSPAGSRSIAKTALSPAFQFDH